MWEGGNYQECVMKMRGSCSVLNYSNFVRFFVDTSLASKICRKCVCMISSEVINSSFEHKIELFYDPSLLLWLLCSAKMQL